MRIMPVIVEIKIFSPKTRYKIISDRNGVINTRLATLETVVEIFKADCHNTKLTPISKSPIYIDPINPSNDGITNELVSTTNPKINGKLNKKIRNKLTRLS